MAALPPTMRAWQLTDRPGKLEDRLDLNQSAPSPDASSLAPNQLLVCVLSAALNHIDYKVVESGWTGRAYGMARGANPGLDFCGQVVAKHTTAAPGPSHSSSVEVGQRVFGSLTIAQRYGTLGEYIIVSTKECAPVPETVKTDDAASTGTAAGAALKSFSGHLFKPGCRVLINGGSGGVGTYAIQFAKILGADRVTATCSTDNVQLCRSLGADDVLDYKQADIITQLRRKGQSFDLLIDNVGTPGLWKHCHEYLAPGGTLVQVATSPALGDILELVRRKLQSFWPGHNRRNFHIISSKASHEGYIEMGQWLADGKARSVIDRVFELEDVPEALRYLRAGHAKGRIIVHVGNGQGK